MTKFIEFQLKSILLLICTLSSLLSCNRSINEINNKQVFRYNEHKNINSLDPAFAKDNANIWAVNQLFNGLVEMDDMNQVKPSISSDWNISENGTLYTFNIRSDIYFHEHEIFGNKKTRVVNASDFEFSFNRLIDPEISSPGSWIFDNVKSFKAVDKNKFQIKLKNPFPAFLGLLSMKYCSVVPKEIIEFYGEDFRKNPVGTGPFYFKKWFENNKLVFRKNKKYFEIDSNGKKLPYLESIAITFLPDKQSEYSQFIQGNLDFISGIDSSYKDDILNSNGDVNKKYKNKIKILRNPYLNTEYLGFYLDSKNPQIQSKLLRKAFNMGFDRNKMIKYLRNSIGIPANGGFIPKGLADFNSINGFKYNPEKAKELIKEYKKLSNNESPSFTISTTDNYLNICEFIQRNLLDIGIEIKIDIMPGSALKSAKANGKTEIFRASWVADYPDSQNFLSLFYSKNFTPYGPNYTHFKNEKFDSIYESSFLETNDSLRSLMYMELDKIVMNEAPVVVLFYDEAIRFIGKNITGLGINQTNLLNLKKVKKSQ